MYHMYTNIVNDTMPRRRLPQAAWNGLVSSIEHASRWTTSINPSSKRLGANQTRGVRGIFVVCSSAPQSKRAAHRHICIIVANDSTASCGSSAVWAVWHHQTPRARASALIRLEGREVYLRCIRARLTQSAPHIERIPSSFLSEWINDGESAPHV